MSEPLLDPLDRAIIAATQSGLPLVPEPYVFIGRPLGLSGEEVSARLGRMLEAGIIRRIGAVPNHYALGLRINAMSVWDVEDEQVVRLGREVGSLEAVSHCYRRPRRLPLWRYNLFAMVHGHTREEVDGKLAAIRALLGDACRAQDVLESTRILKKTGLRIAA